MKKTSTILFIGIVFLFNACVQKAYLKTVVVTLTVPNKKGIQSVGVRGSGKPLSWETDFPLTEVIKDSVYKAAIQATTGYKFAEVKFTVNGEWELKEKPNRKIMFSEKSDTTYLELLFDKP